MMMSPRVQHPDPWNRIDTSMLEDFALGAAFLGSGGGGDPTLGRMLAEIAMASSGAIALLPLASLDDDALVVPCGWIGAPTVSIEKLPNGSEAVAGLRRLEQILGRKVDAVLPIEIGGSNGLAPLFLAARLGIPVVDADGMGRAFPESQMAIFNIAGLSACPSVITSACGTTVTIENAGNLDHERIARGVTVAMGGIAHMVEYPLSGRDARAHAFPGTVSAAIAIGRAARTARREGRDPFSALFSAIGQSGIYSAAGELFEGKIVDVERETRDGFSVGSVGIESFDGHQRMVISFQNENLTARIDGRLVAMVPDIITVMDNETADCVTTERLKYGQRVRVVAASAPAALRTAQALAIAGPAAFGCTDPYQPVEALNAWARP